MISLPLPHMEIKRLTRDCHLGGQLARRLSLPYRSSNTNAANTLDAQAAYESVFSLWGAIMGGVNFLMHGAGWMEGGLQASFEKMALDADLLAMVAEFLRPLRVDEAEMALEAMREVGPGGHFFGAEHTQSRTAPRFSRRRSPTGATTRAGARPARRPPSTRPSASSPSACATSQPRLFEPSASRRSRPSSPAARRKAARRPTFERDPADERLLAERQERAESDAFRGASGRTGLWAKAGIPTLQQDVGTCAAAHPTLDRRGFRQQQGPGRPGPTRFAQRKRPVLLVARFN